MEKSNKKYIDKSALAAEIEHHLQFIPEQTNAFIEGEEHAYRTILSFLDTLEVKEVGDDSLGKFRSLQHITKDLHKTLEDWGYAPNLYYFDGSWHVDWISCEEGDSIKGFTADTPEEAINEAYNWFHSTFCND